MKLHHLHVQRAGAKINHDLIIEHVLLSNEGVSVEIWDECGMPKGDVNSSGHITMSHFTLAYVLLIAEKFTQACHDFTEEWFFVIHYGDLKTVAKFAIESFHLMSEYLTVIYSNEKY